MLINVVHLMQQHLQSSLRSGFISRRIKILFISIVIFAWILIIQDFKIKDTMAGGKSKILAGNEIFCPIYFLY